MLLQKAWNCTSREKAAKEHGVDLSRSLSVGDKDSDKELGVKMGGNGIKLGEKGIKTLLDAEKTIVKENK